MTEPSRAVSRLKLVVAYDGTEFHGFAVQRDVRTVEGVLGDALEKALRAPRELLGLVCAGRTDAGVHAWGQVVSVEAPPDVDPEQIKRNVNRIIAPEVVVRQCELVAGDFDARHAAKSRRYRYTIVNRPEPDPFLARYAWWVPVELDLAQLRLAADPFIGEHDFAAFCRRGPEGSSTKRRVLESAWLPVEREGVLVYEVRANAFCWQMVRSIVGTLVETGAGRRRAGDLLSVIRAGDRQNAGRPAPANGLALWAVEY